MAAHPGFNNGHLVRPEGRRADFFAWDLARWRESTYLQIMNLKDMKTVRLDVRQLSGGEEVLYGEGRGRKLCRGFIGATPAEVSGTRIALDFKGIEHVSASFVREAVLGYAAYLRALEPTAFPFVANMNSESEHELELVLRARGECFVVSRLASSNQITDVRVLCLADGKHLETLETLQDGSEVSVSEVRARLPQTDRPAGTALNGRLQWLCDRGLLASRQDGREKRYLFPFAGGR